MSATVGNLRVELSVGTRRALANLKNFQNNLRQNNKALRTIGENSAMAGKRISDGFVKAAAAAKKFKTELQGIRGLRLKAKAFGGLTALPKGSGGARRQRIQDAMGGASDVRGQMASVTMAATAVTAALTALAAAATATFAKFESGMTRASAIATSGGASMGKAMDFMSKKAIQMAGRSQFSASEVAEGMTFMAMAGNDAAQTVAAMPAAIQLASAAQSDLASATDTVTNILAGFGIKADASASMAEKLADANNILVGTFTNSNTSLGELGEAMKVAAPVAKSLGANIVETSAALGILGNAGIKGTDAGTGLKRILIGLAGTSPKAKKALDLMGVSMETLSKEGLVGVIRQLEIAKEAMGDQAFTGKIFEAFGQIAGPKLAALVGQGADAMEKLQGKIADAQKNNIASILEEKQMATLSGQFMILKSNVEALAISFGETLAPVVKPIVKLLQSMFGWLTNLSDVAKKWIVIAGIAAGSMAAFTAATSGLIAVLLTVKIAMLAATSASMGFAGVMAGMLAPAMAAFAALLAGLSFGFFLAELGTGKDLLSELGSAFSWASESGTNFTTTLKNMVAALASVITKVATIGLVDLGGVFGEWASGASDAADQMDRFGKETSDRMDVIAKNGAEILAIQKELRKLGFKEVGPEFEGVQAGGKGIREFEIKGFAKSGLSVKEFDDAREKAGRLIDLSHQLKGALKDHGAELKKNNKERELANKKREEAAKKAAAEKAAELKKREAEIKAIQKRQQAARKASAEARRAAKLIEKISSGAALQVEVDKAGDMGAIVSHLGDFQSEVGALTKAFKTLGQSSRYADQVAQAQIDLRDILIAQARTHLEGMRDSDNFAASLKKAAKILQDKAPELGITAADIDPGKDNSKLFEGLADAMGRLRDAMSAAADLHKDYADQLAIALSGFPDIDRVGQDLAANLEGINRTFGDAEKDARDAIEKANEAYNEAANADEMSKAFTDMVNAEKSLQKIIEQRSDTEAKARRIGEKNIAEVLNGIADLDRFNESLAFVRASAKRLGVDFNRIAEDVKPPDFEQMTRTQGPSLDSAIGSKVFDVIGSMFSSSANGAAAADAIGGGIASLFTGGGMSIGSTVGAAIGAAFGAPQVGAAIGSALESTLQQVVDSFKNAVHGLIALLPDDRLSSAASSGFEAGSAAAGVAVLASAITGVSALFVGPLAGAVALATFGLGGFFASLATHGESFKRIQDAFATITDQLIQAVDPLVPPFMTLAGLFSAFVPILVAFLPSVEGMTAAAKVVFEVFKGVALAGGGFLMAIGFMQNALIDLAQNFGGDLINVLVGPLTGLANVIVSGADILLSAFETIASLLPAEMRGQLAATRGLIDAIDPNALQNSLQGMRGSLDGFTVDTEAIARAMAEIAGMTFDAALEQGEGLAAMQANVDNLNSTLTNAPEGFKEALHRFNAIRAGELGGNAAAAAESALDAPVINNVGTIIIQVQNDEEAVSKMQELMESGALNMTGAYDLVGKQFNPGHG